MRPSTNSAATQGNLAGTDWVPEAQLGTQTPPIWILTWGSFKTVPILLFSPRNADLTSESGAHYKHNYSSTNPHSLSSAAFMNSMTGPSQFPQDQQQVTQIIWGFLPATARRKSYPVVQLYSRMKPSWEHLQAGPVRKPTCSISGCDINSVHQDGVQAIQVSLWCHNMESKKMREETLLRHSWFVQKNGNIGQESQSQQLWKGSVTGASSGQHPKPRVLQILLQGTRLLSWETIIIYLDQWTRWNTTGVSVSL